MSCYQLTLFINQLFLLGKTIPIKTITIEIGHIIDKTGTENSNIKFNPKLETTKLNTVNINNQFP